MDTKIAGVSLKRILRWVSKTDTSGFNPVPDLKKGLKLDDSKTNQIYAYLKQNVYIQHTGGNSELYIKTAKVISELNTIKRWFEKPIGLIIIGVIVIIIGSIALENTGLNTDSRDWTGFYYPDKDNINDESTWIIQPGLSSLEECQRWVLFDVSKNNTNFDYECGYKCRYDNLYKMTICEETLK